MSWVISLQHCYNVRCLLGLKEGTETWIRIIHLHRLLEMWKNKNSVENKYTSFPLIKFPFR